MDIHLKPIGVVRTKGGEAEVRQKGGLEGELVIDPAYAEALEGIDDYSHLFVIVYFDRLRPEQDGPLQVRPRRLLQRGYKVEELPLLGVFCLDSPTRPNPIGLSLVRLTGREGSRLLVDGLDFFDGTPILDIKGYRAQYRVDEFSVPDWHRRLADAKGHV